MRRLILFTDLHCQPLDFPSTRLHQYAAASLGQSHWLCYPARGKRYYPYMRLLPLTPDTSWEFSGRDTKNGKHLWIHEA